MSSEESQGRLRAEVTLDGHQGEIHLHTISGEESLSAPFRYELVLTTQEIDLDAVRGALVHVHLEDELGQERHVSGMVQSASVRAGWDEHDEGAYRYRLVVVPAAMKLAYRHGFRVHTEASALEIIRTVLRDAGVPDQAFSLTGKDADHPTRALCAQYDETEWDFINRLLEDEGLWYRFVHAEGGARWVMSDQEKPGDGQEARRLSYVAEPAFEGQSLRTWDWRSIRRLCVDKVVVDDYDGLVPSRPNRAEKAGRDPFLREHYEFPARLLSPGSQTKVAARRLDEVSGDRDRREALTNDLGLTAGDKIGLEDHESDDGEYLVTHVRFFLDLDGDSTSARDGGERPLVPSANALTFEAVPADVAVRPARRTRRPRILGFQTARVEGPEGKEINCDELGRVRLRFHWDRLAERGDRTSCWVRVCQAQMTGAIAIPRVGWEVLVSFVDGDPDQPVCHGRLFNPLFPPDYALPPEKPVSALRSNSTPGASSAQEVSFDDSANAERVMVSSPFDFSLLVKKDKKQRVVAHEEHTVGKNRSVEVGQNESIAVEGTGGAQIMVSQDQTISATTRNVQISKTWTEETKGNETLTVGVHRGMNVGNPLYVAVRSLAALILDKAPDLFQKAGKKGGRKLLMKLPLSQVKFVVKQSKKAKKAAEKLAKDVGTAADDLSSAGAEYAELTGKDDFVKPHMDKLKALASSLNPKQRLAKEKDALGKKAKAKIAQEGASQGSLAGKAIADAAGAPQTGMGTWGTHVGGDVKELMDALNVEASGSMELGIGGNSSETAVLRMLKVRGSMSESAAAKNEVVGAYVAKLKDGLSLEAKQAISVNMASEKESIKGGYAIAASKTAKLKAESLTLEATNQVTLKCGLAEVVIDSSGLAIKAAMKVTVEGTSSVKAKEPAIGPG